MEPSTHKEVEEKRVTSTVIRRRTAAPATPPPSGPQSAAPEVSPTETKAKAALRLPQEVRAPRPEVVPPKVPTPTEEPAKKKLKKKGKAELELEAIQRAGGLKHYAQAVAVREISEPNLTESSEAAPEAAILERVFEPTPGTRRKKLVKREFKKTAITEPSATKKMIKVEQSITVSELSQAMGVKTSEIIKKLMGLGLMVTVNRSLDIDSATLIASDFGYEIQHIAFKEEEALTEKKRETATGLQARAPVVTVMGHIDHGKTSILDYIRKTKVAEKEAGGITQHMGAYEVHTPKGAITFIDTPGHEVFTKMRSRGAQATDIVVLVVAADDGVMPQTIEAINHAKAAGVPIVVALNKVDKPGADMDKIKRALPEHGLVPEEWGGDAICVPTSAKTGQGMDQLLDTVLLVAEMKELKADSMGRAKGIILESRLDKGRGPVATALVQQGTLRLGQYVVCGFTYGKIRGMHDAAGRPLELAKPSQAVEIVGLGSLPEAGDDLVEVEEERIAEQIADSRIARRRAAQTTPLAKVSLEEMQAQMATGTAQELKLILKADVAGSSEALKDILNRLSTGKVAVRILHSGVGGITESDVTLAQASQAIILGFNVAADVNARGLAEQAGVDIRTYSIIYEAADEIKKAMEGLLEPKRIERVVGTAQIKQVFKISKLGNVAGSLITSGKFSRAFGVRLIRNGAILYTGRLSSLKRFKDDVREVESGLECGFSIENFNDVKVGDVVEAVQVEEVPETL